MQNRQFINYGTAEFSTKILITGNYSLSLDSTQIEITINVIFFRFDLVLSDYCVQVGNVGVCTASPLPSIFHNVITHNRGTNPVTIIKICAKY